MQVPGLEIRAVLSPFAVIAPYVFTAFMVQEQALFVASPPVNTCGVTVIGVTTHWTATGTVLKPSVMFICPLVPVVALRLK